MSLLDRIKGLFTKAISGTGYFYTFGGTSSRAWKYNTYAREGFRMNPVVYSCLDLICSAGAKIDIVLKNKSNGEVIEKPNVRDLPIVQLISQPNPNESMDDFKRRWMLHMNLSGMAYVRAIGVGVDRGIDGLERSKNGELWLLQPDKVTIEHRDRIVEHYKYGNAEFTPDEVYHYLFPDPLEDFVGMPPLRAAARAVDSHNKSYEWNDKIFENHGVPGLLFGVKGLSHLSETDLKSLMDDWHKRYGGTENVGKVGFFPGEGFDVKELAFNAKDLEWLGGEAMLTRRICGVFKVPPQLLGDPDTSKYSNYKEARRAFYNEKVLPDMMKFIAGLNNWLMPKFKGDYELGLDYSHVEVLRDDANEQVTRLAAASWMTTNEKREAMNLPPLKGGDAVLVPFNLVPLGTGAGSDDGSPKQSKSRFNGSLYPDTESRMKAFNRNVAERDKWEKRYAGEVDKYWGGQKARVLKRLRAIVKSIKATIDINELMEQALETEYYAKELHTINEGLMLDFGQGALAEIGSDLIFDVEQPELQKWLAKNLAKNGKNISVTTADKLKRVLQEGIDAGEGVDKLANRITDMYDGFSVGRAKVIARTEVGIASGEAKLAGYKEGNVSRKEWLSAFVPDTRDDHAAADGQVVGIDESFDIGGASTTTAPCQTGDPGHDVNCLCVMAPMGPED